MATEGDVGTDAALPIDILKVDRELARAEKALGRAQRMVQRLRRELAEYNRPLAPMITSTILLDVPTEAELHKAANWITTDEAATRFGVSRVAILKWVHKGRLRGMKRRWTVGKPAYMRIDPYDLWQGYTEE